MSLTRCAWVKLDKPYYVAYHDTEWGVPVHDDRVHFEMLILEGAQAGLSWDTILSRRAGYRQAFENFDVQRVAAMSDAALESLLADPGIIRNRLKIFTARRNAQVFIAIQAEFGSFNAYIWSFVGGQPIVNRWRTHDQIPARSPEGDALSKDLHKRGMRFVGPVIMYAHMQATGLVNDHTMDCFCYPAI